VRFTFDAGQEYQVHAIDAVVGLLDGQPPIGVDLSFPDGGGFAAIANRLDLDNDALLANLSTVQGGNGLTPDVTLAYVPSPRAGTSNGDGQQDEHPSILVETASGPKAIKFPNFSVEMETGTGKTYVYLRTALELHRRYGLRKYIVVVPSVAVREGVLKTLQMTGQHFHDLYDNVPYRYDVYDSDNLSQVRQFALSDSVEIMVMTIDSFNKAAKNVIHQSTDRLQGATPIHLIQATRPVLILDEPQNMESETSIQALAALDPLFALRYSATHRNPYNVVYRLTPYDAYQQHLVKRIEVASVLKEDDAGTAFLRLDSIATTSKTLTARLALHKLMKDGTVKEQIVTVKPGDDLEEKAERPEYAGYVVDEINADGGFVRFTNDVEIRRGDSIGADKDAIFAAQIRYTVEEHVRKQARLKGKGIKVLSLFFIDRVDNYQPEGSLIRALFERAFDDIKGRYPEWQDKSAGDVQAGYFAQKRQKGGAVQVIDSTSGKSREDEAAYDLIMRNKERLLSFDESVAFIFSHSALREGWDNPNIFQICTLNQTASEMKKRQEIGRGVRLAVDQTGARVHDDEVNRLTIVANESYERYVDQLQREIEQEYGAGSAPPKPPRAERRSVTFRKEYEMNPAFQDLWRRIAEKTRYAVTIDAERLLAAVVPEVDAVTIRPPRVTVTKGGVRIGDQGTFEAQLMGKNTTAIDLSGRAPLPNLVDIMSHLMEYTTPPVRLTRRTLLDVFRRTTNKEAALANPYEFATVVVRILKDKLADQLVEGVRYEKIGEWYEMTQLNVPVESWVQYLVPTEKSVYDHVIYDSDVEKAFVRGLEDREDVDLYLKLPRWFTLPTPVGQYNPDWAIVMKETDAHGDVTARRLYLVRETKDTTILDRLRPDERRKIVCGTHHFVGALSVDYRVVTSAAELP